MRLLKELRQFGKCDHAICSLCIMNAPMVEAPDGSSIFIFKVPIDGEAIDEVVVVLNSRDETFTLDNRYEIKRFSTGSMGCCNPQCFAADLAAICPDPQLRHKYFKMIINNANVDRLTATYRSRGRRDLQAVERALKQLVTICILILLYTFPNINMKFEKCPIKQN
ncbi:unnamed protein product [Toxocara canis]|uniref:Phospholipid scramblase n=1 Tax=Toxocara canis TaxID=6265 RepID=A0A183UT69_TOXCA|nr:unnamed protein product [Toxocara canis]